MQNPFIPVINSLLPEPQASLLGGILFGVKATMPKDLYNALVATGTLHIIALSGMNISILANLIVRMTSFLGKKASSIVTICLIIIFTLFVGASPSIVRAAIMGSVSLLATCFGRLSWGLLSLFLAAGIMLLFNYILIKDLSFQLSFLATFGIITCSPTGELANRKIERQRSKSPSKQLLYVVRQNFRLTFSAQLFTLPVILINFHRISLISPITNLMVEWAVQPIMVLGFIVAILGWIWQPLGIIPAWIVWIPLTYFIKIVELLSKVPGASVSF